jgi:GABA permease
VAQARLDAAVKSLTGSGVTAAGVVSDADPVRAVEQAVAERSVDEIIVVTLPARLSRWLHQDLPGRLAKRTQVPVTDVAMADL